MKEFNFFSQEIYRQILSQEIAFFFKRHNFLYNHFKLISFVERQGYLIHFKNTFLSFVSDKWFPSYIAELNHSSSAERYPPDPAASPPFFNIFVHKTSSINFKTEVIERNSCCLNRLYTLGEENCQTLPPIGGRDWG